MALELLLGIIALVIVGLALVLVLWGIWTYNKIVSLKKKVEETWSIIEVQLKRRYDLIPNLVETVKGYMKHERETLTKVTELRSAIMAAPTKEERMKADNMLTATLKSLFAVAENYPALRANENFLKLQESLEDTENRISYARMSYNSVVRDYNTFIALIPNNIVASFLNAKPEPFFEAGEEAKKAPKVQF
ncbi:MAG: LemA family protein [Candidatus Anstonellales archaeon]